MLAGDGAFQAELSRETREIDAFCSTIDRVDEKYREEFKTGDGRAACSERWIQIKSAWVLLQRSKFKTLNDSYAGYTGLCALVTDWILNYVANYSNLILDPDLDSYWLMDAFARDRALHVAGRAGGDHEALRPDDPVR